MVNAMAKAWWKELLANLAPVAGEAVGGIRAAASETMREAQERVKATVRMVVKSAVVFLILALGLIYVLNGRLEASQGWLPGLGALVVGGVLILLGLFALLVRG